MLHPTVGGSHWDFNLQLFFDSHHPHLYTNNCIFFSLHWKNLLVISVLSLKGKNSVQNSLLTILVAA